MAADPQCFEMAVLGGGNMVDMEAGNGGAISVEQFAQSGRAESPGCFMIFVSWMVGCFLSVKRIIQQRWNAWWNKAYKDLSFFDNWNCFQFVFGALATMAMLCFSGICAFVAIAGFGDFSIKIDKNEYAIYALSGVLAIICYNIGTILGILMIICIYYPIKKLAHPNRLVHALVHFFIMIFSCICVGFNLSAGEATLLIVEKKGYLPPKELYVFIGAIMSGLFAGCFCILQNYKSLIIYEKISNLSFVAAASISLFLLNVGYEVIPEARMYEYLQWSMLPGILYPTIWHGREIIMVIWACLKWIGRGCQRCWRHSRNHTHRVN